MLNRLLRGSAFRGTHQDLPGLNTAEAVKSYWRAMRSTEALSSYNSLFQSFEKSVNADGADRTGARFDEAALAITGLSAADIADLRRFDNRVKHALRHDGDITILREGEAGLAQLALRLKRAADRALLSLV